MKNKLLVGFVSIGLCLSFITPISAKENTDLVDSISLESDSTEITPYGRYSTTLTSRASFLSNIDAKQQIIKFNFNASIDNDTGYLYSATYASHSSSLGSPAYTNVTKTGESRVSNTKIKFTFKVYEKLLGATMGTHTVTVYATSPGPR